MSSKIKTSVPAHLLSGALGGLVVALLALGAYGAGLVDRQVTTVGSGSGASNAGTLVSQPVASTTVAQVFENAGPGVAYIEAASPDSDAAVIGGSGTATGSGFVIDEQGHIVTNAHVVAGADEVRVTLGEDGTPVEAKILGADESTDVAVLQIDPSALELKPLPLGDSDELEVGDPAIAIGNPFGLDRTVTTGIISALHREIEAPNGFTISDALQTDASINPGNSGGPLLDADGNVVGINSQIATGGGQGSVGIGFAVSISTAKTVVDQIIEGGEVQHAFLGVSGGDLTPDLAKALGLEIETGALVQEVVGDGPADQAGLKGASGKTDSSGLPAKGGDVIVAVDGSAVTGFDDVISIVNQAIPGDQLELTIIRDGNQQKLTVSLGDRPAQARS